MYCSKCGAEIGDAKFCPICGTRQEGGYKGAAFTQQGPAENVNIFTERVDDGVRNRVADHLKDVFNDPMFMIIAILLTVSAAVGSISFESGRVHFGVGIISILMAISLWITFASAKSSSGLSPSGPSFTSGVLKASYIINWVGSVALAVGGVLLLVGSSSIARLLPESIKYFDFTPEEMRELQEFFDQLPDIFRKYDIQTFARYGFIVIGIMLLIVAVVLVVVNLCFTRKMHTFAKSVCVSLKSGDYRIEKARACKNWLIVAAVFSLLGGGLSILPFNSITRSFNLNIRFGAGAMAGLASLCTAAACVLASMLINRYFVEGASDY